MVRGDNGRRSGCADVGGRGNGDTVDINPENPRACETKQPVDKYPDKRTGDKHRRFGQSGDRCARAHAGDENVDHGRAHGGRIG